MRARIQLLITGIILAAALLLWSPSAQAQGPIVRDGVPAGETVQGNAVLYGTDILVDGVVEGDVFAIGDNITVNGDVLGSLFLIAPQATVNGGIGGSVYAGVLRLDLAPEAQIARDVQHAGVSLNAAPGSQIGRNLNLIAVGAQLAGSVGNATRAIIGPLEIGRWLMGEAAGSVMPEEEGQTSDASPALRQLAECAPPAPAGLKLASWAVRSSACGSDWMLAGWPGAPAPQETQPEAAGRWLLSRVQELVVLFVLGLLLLWLGERWVGVSVAGLAARPLASLAWGLVLAVNGFLLAVVLAVLIGAAGFGLGAIGLAGLRTVVWLLGYALLLAAFAVFLVLLLYASKVVVAYWLGRLLLRRRLAEGWTLKALSLLVGLVLYVLVAGIPVFGSIAALVISLLGLGAIWLGVRDRTAGQKQPLSDGEQPALDAGQNAALVMADD